MGRGFERRDGQQITFSFRQITDESTRVRDTLKTDALSPTPPTASSTRHTCEKQSIHRYVPQQ